MQRHSLIYLCLLGLLAPFSWLHGQQEVITLYQQGLAKFQAGDVQGTVSLWQQALAMAKRQGNQEFEAQITNDIGLLYMNLGDVAHAVEYLQRAVTLCNATGNVGLKANAFYNLGILHGTRREYANAAAYFEQALQLARQAGNQPMEVKSYSELGSLCNLTQEFQKALTYLEKAMQLAKKMGDRAEQQYVSHKMGNTYLQLADFPKALQLFEQALALAKQLGNQKAAGEALNNIGLIKRDLGEYQTALQYYEAAIQIYQKIGNGVGVLSVIGNIGVVYRDLGNYPKALECFRQAETAYRQSGDQDNLAQVLQNLGVVRRELGDIPAAAKCYEEALQLFQQVGNKRDLAQVANNVGNLMEAIYQYGEALKFLQQALQTHRELGNRYAEGDTLNNIGVVYRDVGNYPLALEHCEQALKIKREIKDRKGEANVLVNIGNIYGNLGDHDQTTVFYEHALKIYKELGDRKGQMECLGNFGFLNFKAGEAAKALDCYQQSLKIGQEIGIPTVQTELNLADLYLAQGKFEEAQRIVKTQTPFYQGRYHLGRQQYGKGKASFLEALTFLENNQNKNVDALFLVYTGLALCCEMQKEYELAGKYYRQSFEILEKMRMRLSQSQKLHFFSGTQVGFSHLAPFEGLARIASETKDGVRGSLYYAEFTRSRLFLEATAQRYGDPQTRISGDLAMREISLSNKIQATEKKLEAAFAANNTAVSQNLETELGHSKKELESLVTQLRQKYPEYAAIRYPTPVYVENIPIREDEVILEYEVTERATKVFLIQGKGRKLFCQDIKITRAELVDLVKQYRSYFEGVSSTAQLGRFDPKVGKRLYDLLLKRFLEAKDKQGHLLIPPDAKIIVMPDEILGVLPFESLVISLPDAIEMSGGNYPSPQGVRYVDSVYDIAYYHSATALAMQRNFRKASRAGKSLFILADPVFSAKDRRAETSRLLVDGYLTNLNKKLIRRMGLGGIHDKAQTRPVSPNTTPVITATESVFFPRLEQTSVLAQRLASKVFAGEKVVQLTDMAASESRLPAQNLEQFKYIVFATHGILANDVPYIQEPALVLCQVNTDLKKRANDGFLTLSEVMQLKLNAEVVALTACQTGLGKEIGGEGVMGLGRAFHYAGAKTVLVSLWSVAEDSTTLMAEKFFQYLQQGKTKRQAIRQARKDVQQAGYQHPFFWAPFILIGD